MKQIRMRIMILSAVWLLISCFLAVPLAKAGTGDVIIDAMKDELDRSMKSLKMENTAPPYYLEYTVWNSEQFQVSAGFGAKTVSYDTHRRLLKLNLRVGDHMMDNTAFVSRKSYFSAMRGYTRPIVLEDDYDAIRRDIWLLTDQAYKEALETLAAKKAFLKNQVQEEEVPDFSKEEPVQHMGACKSLEPDKEKWEKIAEELSAVFREFPSIHTSNVNLHVFNTCRYYVNSEGTVVRDSMPRVEMQASASVTAGDGMKLKHYCSHFARTLDGLPDKKALTAKIKKMAEELTALAKAPVLDNYIGPVLFTGQASAELFAQALAPNLYGHRSYIFEMPQMARGVLTSKLTQRLNRRIMPRDITVVSDPTRKDFGKSPLFGHYAVDAEGVRAKAVTLVDKGKLTTLLMSRRPRKEIGQSNGHGRTTVYSPAGVVIGNLSVTSDDPKSYKELKAELLQMCKDQDLPFALIVKTVDDSNITGVDRDEQMAAYRKEPKAEIKNPVMLYRVYAEDGREELVRGLDFDEVDVDALKDITATGNDPYVYHRKLLPASGMRGYGAGGVPVSIIAPSVLFEELTFKKNDTKRKKPPLLTNPFFK